MLTPSMEVHPVVSPDGRWLAYASDDSGVLEVYVRACPTPGAVKPVSAGGGSEPIWSPKGDRLFFRHGSEVWAADVPEDVDVPFGRPRRLFDLPGMATGQSVRNWDVYSDGSGFLMVRNEKPEPRPATESSSSRTGSRN